MSVWAALHCTLPTAPKCTQRHPGVPHCSPPNRTSTHSEPAPQHPTKVHIPCLTWPMASGSGTAPAASSYAPCKGTRAGACGDACCILIRTGSSLLELTPPSKFGDLLTGCLLTTLWLLRHQTHSPCHPCPQLQVGHAIHAC